MKKVKVFLFANLPVSGVEVSYGGATILSENILKFLKSDDRLIVTHKPIRNTWKPKLHFIDHLMWIFKFPFIVKKQDVIIFHGTWDFNFTIAPILWVWAKLLNKRIIYQVIGGSFINIYKSLPSPIRFIYNSTLLKSDYLFFETLDQVDFFKSKNVKNCIWIPNARKPVDDVSTNKSFEKKFIFLSRIIPEKGIDEIIEVSTRLPDDYKIEIIGPLNERYYTSQQLNRGKANFTNALINPDELKYTLSQYDVLLLPTYFNGEGYPGIIIDCLALGIPVITTNWRALPEMIQHKYNGYLVDIKNIDQLEEAILHFDNDNYSRYRENAFKIFEKFNTNIVVQKIVKSCLDE